MAQSVDRMWINKAISEFNRSSDKSLDRLTDDIIRHGMFDASKREFLLRHLEASIDDGSGRVQTNATEIYDLFNSMPAKKTLKLSGNMMTMDIDRGSGKVLHPDDVVEKLLSEDEAPAREPGHSSEELQKVWQHGLDLEKFFNENGVECSYEYPGYLSCPSKLGTLNIGTVDGYWDMSLFSDDGSDINVPDELQDAFGQFKDADPMAVTPDNLLNAAKRVLAWANT